MKIQGSTTINRRVDGENAISYTINPSHKIIQFSINSNTGQYTPDHVDFTCGYCRTDGKSTEVHDGSLRGDTLTITPEGSSIMTLFRYIKKDGTTYPEQSRGWIWFKDCPISDSDKKYTGKNLKVAIDPSTEYASIECVLCKNISTSVNLSSSDDRIIDRIVVPILKEAISVQSIEAWYKKSNSSVKTNFNKSTAENDGWKTDVPDSDEKYLWYTLITTYTDGSTMQQGPMIIGSLGDVGVGISSIITKYYNSNKKITSSLLNDFVVNDDRFKDEPCDPTSANPYLYRLTFITKTNGDIDRSADLIQVYAIKQKYSDRVDYCVSNSGTVPPENWVDNIPEAKLGDYLWTRRQPKYPDGTLGAVSYTVTRLGIDGSKITKTSSSKKYAVTNDNVQPSKTSGVWKDNLNDVSNSLVPGTWLWTWTVYEWSDNVPTEDIVPYYMGKNGETIQLPGSYMHLAYSTSSDGTQNFMYSSDVTNNTNIDFVYIGTCENKYTANVKDGNIALTSADYTWVRIAQNQTTKYELKPTATIISYDRKNKNYSPFELDCFVVKSVGDSQQMLTDDSQMPNGYKITATYSYYSDEYKSVTEEYSINDSIGFGFEYPGRRLVSDVEFRLFCNNTQINSVTIPLIQDGTQLDGIVDLYKASNDNTKPPTIPDAINVISWYESERNKAGSGNVSLLNGWQTASVTTKDNKYLWNYTVNIYHKGYSDYTTPYTQSSPIVVSTFNKDITKISDLYCVCNIQNKSAFESAVNTGTLKPTEDITEQPALSNDNSFLWNKEIISYTTGDLEETDWRIIGTHGKDGESAVQYEIITPTDIIYCDSNGKPLGGQGFYIRVLKTYKGVTSVLDSSKDVHLGIAFARNTAIDMTLAVFDKDLIDPVSNDDALVDYLTLPQTSNGYNLLKTDTKVYDAQLAKDIGGSNSGYIGRIALYDKSGYAIARKTLLFVKQGKPGNTGLKGCVLRSSRWEPGKEYRNDTNKDIGDGIGYIDTVWFRNDNGEYLGYICKKTHVSVTEDDEVTKDNTPPQDVTIDGKKINSFTFNKQDIWEKIENLAPMSVPFLFAGYATINMLLGDQILIQNKNDDGTFSIDAGLTGGEYPLWVGTEKPIDSDGNKAPFVVSKSGEVTMSNARINGYFTSKFEPIYYHEENSNGDEVIKYNATVKNGIFYIKDIFNLIVYGGDKIVLPNDVSLIGAKIVLYNADNGVLTRSGPHTTASCVRVDYAKYSIDDWWVEEPKIVSGIFSDGVKFNISDGSTSEIDYNDKVNKPYLTADNVMFYGGSVEFTCVDATLLSTPFALAMRKNVVWIMTSANVSGLAWKCGASGGKETLPNGIIRYTAYAPHVYVLKDKWDRLGNDFLDLLF